MNEIELLTKWNNEYRQTAVDKLVSGGAKDFAEYRELVGVIRGLDHANFHLQDLKLRMEKINDE